MKQRSKSLANVRHFVLDMDGTIYLGGVLFPATRPFLSVLNDLGIGYTFITNNNVHSRASYVTRLRNLGIPATDNCVITSAHATIHYLQDHLPSVRRLLVVGSADLDAEFEHAGFEVVNDEPHAVVVGFDLDLTYDKLSRAAYWISQAVPYIATHPDRVCPTNLPTVLPDCGAICALLEAATGRKPDAVPGKPNPLMLARFLRKDAFRPDEIAVVGDRIYTDMRMARDAGAMAILTLTGEATPRDLGDVPPDSAPDLVINDLAELTQQLVDLHQGVTGRSPT